jgi:hypothetical protein
MAKVTIVALATREGVIQEFEIDHAERILAIPRCGWHLPEDSEFELTKDGTINRRSKEKGDRAKKA